MSTTENPYFTTFSVGGMTCNHCKATVEKNISAIEGVDEVTVDLSTGNVKVGGSHIDIDRIVVRVKELGYEYKGKI
jgi:copper chaperone CopZ